jgi:hypothetical protein
MIGLGYPYSIALPGLPACLRQGPVSLTGCLSIPNEPLEATHAVLWNGAGAQVTH